MMEIFLSLAYDREDNLPNLALILIMYFTYCQLWIYVVGRGLYEDYVIKREIKWDKTPRMGETKSAK